MRGCSTNSQVKISDLGLAPSRTCTRHTAKSILSAAPLFTLKVRSSHQRTRSKWQLGRTATCHTRPSRLTFQGAPAAVKSTSTISSDITCQGYAATRTKTTSRKRLVQRGMLDLAPPLMLHHCWHGAPHKGCAPAPPGLFLRGRFAPLFRRKSPSSTALRVAAAHLQPALLRLSGTGQQSAYSIENIGSASARFKDQRDQSKMPEIQRIRAQPYCI